MTQSNTAIIQSDFLQDAMNKGFDQIGGLENLFDKTDDVLINFGGILPLGNPSHVSFDLIKNIALILRNYGIKSIYAICRPYGDLPLKKISKFLGLDDFFKEIKVDFLYLDGSNLSGLKSEELKMEKSKLLEKTEVNGKKYLIPKILKHVKKYILLTQINSHLKYGANLALNNLRALLLPENKSSKGDSSPKNIDATSLRETNFNEIVNAYLIRKPDIVINDMRYSISGGGDVPYKSSKYHMYSTMIFGVDALTVDLITLNILNFDPKKNPIIGQLQKVEPFKPVIDQFSWSKDNPQFFDYRKVEANFEDFYLKNISIVQGEVCSLCYENFFNLINVLQTFLAKDLNYIRKSVLFVGKNPPNLEIEGIPIVFGDCAINSTHNYHFRTIKPSVKTTEDKPSSEKNSKVKTKLSKVSDVIKPLDSKNLKSKKNKKILELPGCPPTIFDCFNRMIRHFGKSNMPQLRLILDIARSLQKKQDLKLLNNWKVV